MSNKIFVGRVTAEEMNGSYGPWIKTKISFNVEDMTKLQEHMNDKGFVNLNFNRSKKGSEYIEIDTWQPTQQPQATPPPVMQPMPSLDATALGGVESDIPFNRLGDFEQ